MFPWHLMLPADTCSHLGDGAPTLALTGAVSRASVLRGLGSEDTATGSVLVADYANGLLQLSYAPRQLHGSAFCWPM